MRKGFHEPYSSYGHYEGLTGEELSEWHPAFLQLAPTLVGCARRYAQNCRRVRPRAEEWQQLAQAFRRANGARTSSWA